MTSKYDKLPLSDIARRYLGDETTPAETMPALATEFNANVFSLYRRLVRDGLIPRAPKGSHGGGRVSKDEFIEIWNSSSSADEAGRRAKVQPKTAVLRAVEYRKKGIVMKLMPKHQTFDERSIRVRKWQQEKRERENRTWPAARNDPGGRFRRHCWNPQCPNSEFQTDNPRIRYCSPQCCTQANNLRNNHKSSAARRAAFRYELTCRNADCPHGFTFRSANRRALYCCDECQKSAQNARNYARRKARQK